MCDVKFLFFGVVGRVVSSTQLEDRRDAVRAIKALAKKFKNEVGSLCTEVLLNVLRNDKDSEIIGYAVESLLTVTELDQPGSSSGGGSGSGDGGGGEVGIPEVRYSEEIVKNTENITLLLNLLEEFEFGIRRPTTLLLWVLLRHKRKEMQEAVLVIPMGISRIMDLLLDSREVIRNDAILLLAELTASNKQIQKIVAFENAFDRLLAVIREEGYSEGGIVVEDCIKVLLNLLHGNNSNQSYFRETNLLGQLVPYFDFNEGGNWSPQKVDNVLQMLQLIRTLVSPNNPQQSTVSCQKLILQCQLLESLCVFMFAGGVPTEVLTDTITTVAEAIRGCEPCQTYMEGVSTPSNPPRSAILAILMSMVTERQPLVLRLSALYCFLCYVYKNERSQGNIINTLLPSSTEPTSISPGQILIAGLFGNDPLSNWCSAVAISNSLNEGLKPQLLRVQLSVQGGSQVTLLQQITMFLSQHSAEVKVQTRVGLLTLLCTWLADCSMGITQFLNDSSNVPFLIGQLEQNYTDELGQLSRCLCASLLGVTLAFNTGASSEYNQSTLRQIIEHRIGKDAFVECLRHISSSEFFTRAAKHPHNRSSSLGELCFDHSFTVFFKQVSDVVIRSLDSNFVAPQNAAAQSQSNGSVINADTSIEDHDSIVNQYKELIRDQDEELTSLRQKYDALEKLRERDARSLKDQNDTIKVLQEQVSTFASLKDSVTDGAGGGGGGGSEDRTTEIEALKNTITSMQRVQDSTRQELASRDVTIARMEEEVAKLSTLQENLAQSRAENEALLTYSRDMENEMGQLQEKLRAAATQVPQVQPPPTHDNEERERLMEKVRQLEASLAEATEMLKITSTQVQQPPPPPKDDQRVRELEANLAEVTKQLKMAQAQNIQPPAPPPQKTGGGEQVVVLEQKVRMLEASLAEVTEKKQLMEAEQEDLLMLLADNDTRIKKLSALLIEKGIEVPEEEEPEESDSEEERGEEEVD